MKTNLLPFYFGSIADDERLLVERELLTDPETLVDYFDLKRSLEAAAAVPALSSRSWARLEARLGGRKKAFFSLGAAVAAAAALVAVTFLHSRQAAPLPVVKGAILFDSSSELPASSSVL